LKKKKPFLPIFRTSDRDNQGKVAGASDFMIKARSQVQPPTDVGGLSVLSVLITKSEFE
jgi:hypothetical protein